MQLFILQLHDQNISGTHYLLWLPLATLLDHRVNQHAHPLNLDLHVHAFLSCSLFALQVKTCSLYPVDTSVFGLGLIS